MEKGKKEVMFERMQEQKKELRIVRRIVFLITVVVLLVLIIGGFSTYRYINNALKPLNPESEEKITVEIPIGSGLDSISKKLEEEGLIKSARIFKYYAKFNNESQFQAGTYALTKAMSPDELIQSLKTGTVYREPVFTMTIPEGLTLEQIAKIVEQRTNITAEEFMTYINSEETIARLKSLYPNLITDEVNAELIRYPLEGYLFPATYPFYEENPSLETIVNAMVEATSTNIVPFLDFLEKEEKSVHYLLTFASLLEKEATAKADRQTIASVFYNRLEDGMMLQTDPTVLYALGEHKDRVLYKDLEIDNPYNTYKVVGLPPGPIANAGKASIEAVIDPSETDYFYFLADKEGNNHFTHSYEEHLKNRARYLSGD